jgi:hypothetical protein
LANLRQTPSPLDYQEAGADAGAAMIIRGFSHFVTSMAAPVASGRSGCRVGLYTYWTTPPCHGVHPNPTLDLANVRSKADVFEQKVK